MADVARKIYTSFGDRGLTRLLGGGVIGKDDLRVNTYGAVDELQSHLGMARSVVQDDSVRSILHTVQKDLFVAGAALASTPELISQLGNRITERDVSRLEDWIDGAATQVGMPDGFIMPGTSPDCAALHVARSVCRRVERLVVRLNRITGTYQRLIVYFSRLSDLLFMLAWSLAVRATAEGIVDELIAVYGC